MKQSRTKELLCKQLEIVAEKSSLKSTGSTELLKLTVAMFLLAEALGD